MEHPILKELIEKLNFSAELKQTCRNNKFLFLDEIIVKNTDVLLNKYKFTMHQIMEIIELLEQNGLKNDKWA